jgi:hypothetical protein
LAQKHDAKVLQWEVGSCKIRTWQNADEEGSRITSRLEPSEFSACFDTRRNGERVGERNVKGGEDDWEGDGELHVCSNRCSRDVGHLGHRVGSYLCSSAS